MCIWYLKGEDDNYHPMDKISQVIADYLIKNGSDEQGLRDHLSDKDSDGIINGCGCGDNKTWQFTKTPNGYEVVIEPHTGSVFKVTVNEDGHEYEATNRTDSIEGYDDMVINDDYELPEPITSTQDPHEIHENQKRLLLNRVKYK